MSHFQDHNPFLPVDWRYRRACSLLERDSRLSRKWDDKWTRQALRLLQDLRRCRDDAARQRLAHRMPTLHAAHVIHSIDPPDLRWAIEARLLAGEPLDRIAKKCASTTTAVEAYEKVFFNVLDRLNAPDHVVTVVIGLKADQEGQPKNDIETTWKLLGYHGGPNVLDVLIDGYTDQPEEVDQFLGQYARSTLLRKLAIAARALPVNDETAVKVLELFGHLVKAEVTDPAAGSIRDNLAAVLSVNPQGIKVLNEADGSPEERAGALPLMPQVA